MIRLHDLRIPFAITWEEAERFIPPSSGRYNIARDCLSHPHNSTAIIEANDSGDEVVTYGELDRRSASVAASLVERGLSPGARVAIKLSQSIDMAVVVLATIRAGGIVVPLSNVLARSGLEHRIADSAPSVVVAADGDPVFDVDTDAEHLSVSELHRISLAGATQTSHRDSDADEPALLLYTSGTTGKPKGVLHGHRVLLGHHAVDLAFDHIRAGDIAYSPVDWTWAGGMMLGLLVPLGHGITIVAHREPRFDPAATIDLMERTGISIGLFPPTVLRMLRASGAFSSDAIGRTRLRCFITGAEAVDPELIGWGRELGISINNAYGQTEANALVGHAASLSPQLDQATMGRPYPGHRIAILDDDLAPVAGDTPGQLAVSADDPVCMLRYWNNPDATSNKIRAGWLLTGDTVHRDRDGSFHFHGRSDDIIKSGAYRLGPAEIEAAVLRHEAVAECAAIGLPDEIRGEVVAVVVRIDISDLPQSIESLADELRALVRNHVGAHAYPRVVRVVDELPKTTTNKIDRAALRRSMLEGAS